MRHDEFKIGTEFDCSERRWRCTDVGTRTIVAICLSDRDSSWFTGPPYAVEEEVFDENDMPACEEIKAEASSSPVV